ncbi:type II secretion system protein [Dactylosporangium sp. CA-139066]|uniref:type II secretion system protein n=1 Tax=Dactylosporangium sp. CA-139066 TaxID=3239930 RepID=UPI003D9166A7
MLQRIRAVRENESGFTLIELLIVIVILGILSGIVVFAVGAFNDRGQAAACKTDKKNVEVAVEAYRAKKNAYPTKWDDLTGGSDQFLREQPSTTNGYTIDVNWGPGGDGKVTSTGAC